MPAAARPGLGHLAGTLSTLEPMEIGFIRDTVPGIFVSEEFHEVTDLTQSGAARLHDALQGRSGAETFCSVDPAAGPQDERTIMTMQMAEGDIVAGEIRRIEMKPGDRFVLMIDKPLTMVQRDRVRELWRRFWERGAAPELLLLDDGAKLSLVRCEDDATPV